ncbi:response regulator [Leisingera sp.]|uniref:response regulator n=1 Tax=Leisingera sp. TaxID=1879318 RepID=UPI002B26EC2E|nr:response regulator [Leisingera sp.]
MDLENQLVLIVEDDFLIAMDLAETVREAGAEVAGPAASVNEALDLLSSRRITVAVLDVNLGKEQSLAVAERLTGDQIPFVYHTGRKSLLGTSSWPEAPVISKPAIPSVFVAMIADAAAKRSDRL